MCVIAYVEHEDHRPSAVEVKAMWDSNPAGGGVAWREDGLVRWQKGLTEEEMQEKNRTLPLPYVLHFRVPSVGGNTSLLTHPFPLEPDARLDLEGSTKVGVLFHNGTLPSWELYRREWTKPGMEFPGGPWSDSRTMAYLIGTYCPKKFGMVENLFASEKLLLFAPSRVVVSGPTGKTGWTVYDKRFLASNDFFEFRLPHKAVQGVVVVDRRLPGHYRSGGTDGATEKEELPGGALIVRGSSSPPPKETPPVGLIAGAPEVPLTRPMMQALVSFRAGTLGKKALKRLYRRYQQQVLTALKDRQVMTH